MQGQHMAVVPLPAHQVATVYGFMVAHDP